jgi:hypothetical protein
MVLVALLGCVAWVAVSVLAPTQPAPALQRAIAARLGVDVSRLTFERMAENDGCTIVEVATSDSYRSVAARQDAAGWTITKVSTDADHFDLDEPDWERVCTPSA